LFLEEHCAAPRNPQPAYLAEPVAFRHGERLAKRVFPYVPPRLGKKDPALRSQDVVHLPEESHGIFNFMDNGEQQGEVDLTLKVWDAEGVRRAQPRLDPVEHACATCPAQ